MVTGNHIIFLLVKDLAQGQFTEAVRKGEVHMKGLAAAVVAVLLAASIIAYGAQGITVTIDGQPVKFSGGQPRQYNGRVMVPIRGVFEALGAMVQYDAASHRVYAKKANEEIELRVGNKIAKKNGAEIILDTPPRNLGGKVMVPLRFIAESLRSDVRWDQASRTVIITTLGGEPPDPPH
ncbi:MAG TPA: copper amine oxidase N-terminal domain-containing protein [Fimbriimonadaceae bacterium]|jgi:hypothetical protein|nr:copper amine oxidase N-terminal domain-containing protein [Fimbriimonadaceae bacterium]